MTAPTTSRTSQPPALAAYRRHVLDVCRTGDPKVCAICFDLERDASAEAWRRATQREMPARG